MSEETNTMLEHKYEDQFSYLTEEGDLMLKETVLFEERKIAEIGSEEEMAEVLENCKKAFGELKEKVDELVQRDDLTSEAVEDLKNELKKATAIGDYESLVSRLKAVEGEIKTKTEEESPKDSGTEDQTKPGTLEETDETAEESTGQAESESELLDSESEEESGSEDEEGIGYYKNIVDRAEELSKQTDWPYVSMELDNLSHQWDEGPDLEDQQDQMKELLEHFQQAVEAFETRKEEHYEELNKQKKKNLEKKQDLIEQLDDVVSNKNWTAVKKVNSIKGQFRNIGILPSGKGDELDEKFNALLEEFEEHKVDRLVSKRQQEEDNLTGKLIVLDKMEELAKSIDDNTKDWKAIDKEFDRLTTQYKKIGRVPPEKSDEVWERYKSAQDEYYDQKYKFDQKHRQKFDKYFQKKEDLCKKAEALLEEEDLASAARELNKLHRRWKKTGNLPQRDEDKLWARFKAATDTFNERKSENIDLLREQEEENYQKKLELIERAKEINDTTDWDKGHSKMQSLLDEWKKAGPVPRNKSRKLWKKFKSAQDVFYDRRREHFKERKEEQKENLKEKEEILKKLRELGQHKDPFEAVDQAKPLQEEFKKAGYVPIKKKNQIWKEYREACDVIYERYRAAKSGNKFDQELAKADLDPDSRSKIMDMRKEYKKIKHELHKLEEEVLQYKESKTYFKSSNDDSPLLNEIREKIEKAETKLQKKQEKLDSLDSKIEDLRESS